MSLVTNLILVYLIVLKECILADSTDIWPSGYYGIPKAKSGCPANFEGVSWKEEWIRQDLEDDDNKSNFSSSFHMDAVLTDEYVKRTFCMKREYTNDKLWPKGTYCIYKKYSYCPTKMQTGSIRWDDENTDNDNGNSGYYYLPAGSYGRNTLMHYCCQDEGYWFNSIELPVDCPFYLLPHKSPHCQRVKWALSSLEYIVYDTENDHNDDQFSGSHVFSNEVKSLPKIYYCYYKGCRFKLKSDNGSFTSSRTASLIYPDFQYCSWLVTVNETLLISLIFTSIRVPNCQENFIDIYDGRDKTFPLLARYCGSNATVDNKLISTGNNLYLVFKTGNNSLNDNMHPEFHANYSTHLKPELWPYGTYGLPKAISGCPDSGGGVWGEGYIFQDMDNDTPRKSKLSDSFHMEAKLTNVNKDINRTFCIKKYPGTFNRSWPTGSYCIYKKCQCPLGMLDGSVKWDDQSYGNRQSGFLPDGTYNYGATTIEYCCQDEGYWFNSIELPVDRPFYLLPHKSPHCQRVKWALSSLEYIVYDTENYYNDDQFSDSHVFTNKVKSLPKMYYCYYEGCRRQKLHGDSGSFSSLRKVSDIYPDFQYCSWLITVNKPLLVSLSFTSIHVHNCEENHIEIYDGSNETFPLLARYCDLSAAEANKVKSSANNLYVVFKSGNNSLNPGIHLKFNANYTSAKQDMILNSTSKPKENNSKDMILNSTSKPKENNSIIPNNQSSHNFPVKYISAGIVGTIIILAIIVIYFIRLRKIRDRQHPKREETLHGDYETQLTAVVDANVTNGVCSFQANGSNRDDSYVIHVETSEVITDSFNIPSNCEVSDAVSTNEYDGYVIPDEATSETSPNKQHYEALDVLRRKDDEHEYQPLGRISDADGSNENHGYVIPAETISEVAPCSSNTERNGEVFDAVTKEDQAGYLIPAKATSKMPPSKQHYEALDFLRRQDDEHEYQSLVRISDVNGNEENHDYVIPAETALD